MKYIWSRRRRTRSRYRVVGGLAFSAAAAEGTVTRGMRKANPCIARDNGILEILRNVYSCASCARAHTARCNYRRQMRNFVEESLVCLRRGSVSICARERERFPQWSVRVGWCSNAFRESNDLTTSGVSNVNRDVTLTSCAYVMLKTDTWTVRVLSVDL